jgi:hypothetical protein
VATSVFFAFPSTCVSVDLQLGDDIAGLVASTHNAHPAVGPAGRHRIQAAAVRA